MQACFAKKIMLSHVPRSTVFSGMETSIFRGNIALLATTHLGV